AGRGRRQRRGLQSLWGRTTAWFLLPGPEADSSSPGRQQLKLSLTLGREMKFSSVTCALVSKAGSGSCGEKRPEARAGTSNQRHLCRALRLIVTQAWQWLPGKSRGPLAQQHSL
ncbi:kelch-like 25 (Drosophila), isoform CRA_a, partial [Mus musculus]